MVYEKELTMQMSPTVDKILPALLNAQGQVLTVVNDCVFKDEQSKYNYASFHRYLTAIKPILNTYGLIVTFGLNNVQEITPKNEQRFMTHFIATVTVHIIHAESGQWITETAVGEGVDTGDKASLKAQTAGRRTALAGIMAVASGEDPESGTVQSAPSEPLPVDAASKSDNKTGLQIAEETRVRLVTRVKKLLAVYTVKHKDPKVVREKILMVTGAKTVTESDDPGIVKLINALLEDGIKDSDFNEDLNAQAKSIIS